MNADEVDRAVRQLLEIMARLRDPDRGCPWDLEQDFHSISRHTLEKAYEVADSCETGTGRERVNRTVPAAAVFT